MEMLLLFFTLLLAALILLVIYWYVVKWTTDRVLCNVKGPTPIPLFGNALDFGNSSSKRGKVADFCKKNMFSDRLEYAHSEIEGILIVSQLFKKLLYFYVFKNHGEDQREIEIAIMKKLSEYSTKYGNFKVFIGFRPCIVICDYNMVEFFLTSNSHLAKSLPYKMLHSWLGRGLLTGDGEKWKKHRKILTPAFHFQILATFLPVFDKASNILVDQLKECVNAKNVDIYPYITKLTLDLICESAMGITVNAQTDPNTKYIKAVKEICQIIVDRTFSPIKSNDSLYLLTPTYQAQKNCLKYLQDATTTVIKQRRKLLYEERIHGKEITTDEDEALSIGTKKKFVFLDMLLQAELDGESLSDSDIREEVNTFLFAGHDTTASGISFTLFAIANEAEVQNKLVAELRQIFGEDKNRTATYQDLQNMKYMEMVIKESLRLYTPVPAIGREQAYDLEYNGQTIPANTACVLFLYGIHRNPEYFPDPEKFDPLRFSHDNKLGKSPFSYIPFSAGPRNCIGQKFAMLEMKATIAKILRNYKLLPCPENHKLDLVFEITLKSSTGIKIKLENRNW